MDALRKAILAAHQLPHTESKADRQALTKTVSAGLVEALTLAEQFTSALKDHAPNMRFVPRGMVGQRVQDHCERMRADIEYHLADAQSLEDSLAYLQTTDSRGPATVRAGVSVGDTSVLAPAHLSPITALPPRVGFVLPSDAITAAGSDPLPTCTEPAAFSLTIEA